MYAPVYAEVIIFIIFLLFIGFNISVISVISVNIMYFYLSSFYCYFLFIY